MGEEETFVPDRGKEKQSKRDDAFENGRDVRSYTEPARLSSRPHASVIWSRRARNRPTPCAVDQAGREAKRGATEEAAA